MTGDGCEKEERRQAEGDGDEERIEDVLWLLLLLLLSRRGLRCTV